MELINLTPHVIKVVGTNGDTVEFQPSGQVARVASIAGNLQKSVSYPNIKFFSAPTWGEVEGLPAPQGGKAYIVSGLVAARCSHRADVFSPGTGPADEPVRENGQIVAVTRLIFAMSIPA
jgi:hypothetical protein